MTRFKKRWLAYAFLTAWIGVGAWHTTKPLPEGLSVSSPLAFADSASMTFLADRSFNDIRGRAQREQQIFDAVFDIVDRAESFVVADFFLFNSDTGAATSVQRRLSSELTQHLKARKLVKSGLTVLVITDPINDVYGGRHSPVLDDLRDAGIDVVITDLSKLRDSNPAYSALWRMFIQWFGNAPDRGRLPNPFGGPSNITLRSWLALLNFKANHRKVVVADRADGGMVALVTSANPHDASSAHSNVGMQVEGDIAHDILASELAVARFSGWQGTIREPARQAVQEPANPVQASYVTEEAIRDHLLHAFAATRRGDAIRIAVFYLADRKIVAALLDAANRGVAVKLILDPNKDAFGRQKDGVPNRPVASELVSKGGGNIEVRWYRTHGEQFHTKLALVTQDDRLIASVGSANFTRRNLGAYNLEANLALDMPLNAPLATQMQEYFEGLWSNSATRGQDPQFTAPFGAYEDKSSARYWRYRLMEATGLSTF